MSRRRERLLETAFSHQIIGGVKVGDTGAVGSIYEGYTLSWGDDFRSLNIISPANSRGRWWTTKVYGPSARGNDSLLNSYDADPYFTGYNDSNRGVPVGFSNNMSVSNSVLSLQARLATTDEKNRMTTPRAEVGAMIAGIGAILWYPGTNGSEDIIIDYNVKHGTSNPGGWHPDLWTDSFNGPYGTSTNNNNQSNFEGNDTGSFIYQNDWAGAPTGSFTSTKYQTVAYNHDNSFHTITFKQSHTSLVISKDGVFQQTVSADANNANKPQFPIITSHVYNSTFNGDDYAGAEWISDTDGATLAVDYIRVWRRTGKVHYRPLTAMADQYVTYGQSTVIQLPSATAIWGTTPTNEYLQAVPTEENEPGVTHTTSYNQFPDGVSYDSGTRQLTVNISSGKSGRINFVLGAWEAGGTCEPLRFAVNLSPNITLGDFSRVEGSVSIDLYDYCDCGVLVPKVVAVTNLGASGLSFDPVTCILSGTAVVGTYSNVVISCTNLVGQTTEKTVTISIVSGADYRNWPGPGRFDFNDTASITMDGASPPNVISVANQITSAGGDLTYFGTAGLLDYIANITAGGSGNMNGVRLTRGTTGSASIVRPRLAATSGSTLNSMFRGNDKPYTVICAFKPTDTNTGYIWTASDTVDTTDSQIIGLIRRSGSASSVRRQVVTATPLDVSWGSGFASGTKRVVAIKYTGTAVTVWDNSATTKSVNGTSQDAPIFNDELAFALFVAETLGASDPLFQDVQCALDFYEIVISDAAQSDANIQQAITDMATKWGVTLS